MKIAILMPSWLGDFAMATPAIRAIHRHFGAQAAVIGIMRPYQASLLAGTDWLDEQWYYDPRCSDRRLGFLATASRLRREKVETAVLLPNTLRTALLTYLGGVTNRVGYVQYGRGSLLTTKLPAEFKRGDDWVPQVDRYLRIAEAIGCPPESRRLELATTPDDEQSADQVFERLGIRNNRRPVLLNAGSAAAVSRLWPVERFGGLAQRIANQLDQDVLVLCGPQERELAGTIVELAKHPRVFSMADQPLDLGTAKACLRRGSLLVSTDSGPRHVAAALGVPVIGLFGPVHPGLTRNSAHQTVEVHLDLDCFGCKKRICPLGHNRCMRDLSVDMVFSEVEKLLVGPARPMVVLPVAAQQGTLLTPSAG